MANAVAKLTQLKRKYNQREEEILYLKEQIRELESNRCNSNNVSQAAVTRLELDLDAAKGDCIRLREENNALRNDMQRLKENQRSSEVTLQQAKEDFNRCVSQFEVERNGFNSQIKQISEELRLCQERARELQSEASDQRSRCNHLKLASEQTQRELMTTQDLLHQTEAQLRSALGRVQDVSDEAQALEWQLKEARQERSSLKANLAQLDQEKDALLLNVDEKTEQVVRVEAELEARDRKIASLEGFVADLQKKLDVALDTAARSEQTSRQMTQDTERLRKQLDEVEMFKSAALNDNSRLQNDLAAITSDHQQLSRCLESSKREVEDLKLQLQGYVAEVRRITDVLEQKEAERMAMLEQYRSLSAESAHLESNNHSLESKARSTRTCLREAHNRVQDLEATLNEKKALVHGYEKQIKELTHQVAKLERKLEARSRAESANKDLSRELEGQKHCLENRVDQLTCVNKQLEEEVGELRSEVCHLKEQLSKERKNSATLEDVLVTTRQETLVRTRDNSELKGQVQCLQSKLRELHDKLEHGSEALRRCQTECEDYQAQVSDLKRELTNERVQRARLEENRRSRKIHRALKLVASRSRSLGSLHSLPMASSQTCTCCFLNRISSLRNNGRQTNHNIGIDQTDKFMNAKGDYTSGLTSKRYSSNDTQKGVTNFSEKGDIYPEIDSEETISSMSVFNIDSGNISEDLQECMIPERLISEPVLPKSSEAPVCGDVSADESNLVLKDNEYVAHVKKETKVLLDKIDSVLQEHREFVKELNLPICDEGHFGLISNLQSKQSTNIKGVSERKRNKLKFKKTEEGKITNVNKLKCKNNEFFCAGDQKLTNRKDFDRHVNNFLTDSTSQKRCNENKHNFNKNLIHFDDEPVKLSTLEWVLQNDLENSLDSDSKMNKNVSVELLFSPKNKFKRSNSSDGSSDMNTLVKASSVYVTAPNSQMVELKELNSRHPSHSVADSCSKIALKTAEEGKTLREAKDI